MNSGIHDAFALIGILGQLIQRGHDDALLDTYSSARRTVATTSIARQSDANWSRLRETDPHQRVRQREHIQALANDPESARSYLRQACMLDPDPYLPFQAGIVTRGRRIPSVRQTDESSG
jgi:3-(3-hydroxy-phenyl)propionate hydroxylase